MSKCTRIHSVETGNKPLLFAFVPVISAMGRYDLTSFVDRNDAASSSTHVDIVTRGTGGKIVYLHG